MTENDLINIVKTALYSVAPDIEGEEIDREETFRDQFEIDSMDFLNFVVALHGATGLEIPEKDYPQLATLSGCLAYLKANRVEL